MLHPSLVVKFNRFFNNIKTDKKTLWGRWCLPMFNEQCNQNLKGGLADMDNNLCNGKPISSKFIKN